MTSRGKLSTAEVPSVSVIIPCKDPTHLETTLSSLADQVDAPAFEVIIVDDTDTGVEAAVATPAGLHTRAITADMSGTAGRNRNIGVSAAEGEHLLFVDADDAVNATYVGTMSAALESHVLVCARISLEQFHGSDRSPGHQQTGPIVDPMWSLPFAQGGSLGIRRDVFERVGGFNEKLRRTAEADLCWRVQLEGTGPPRFVPDAVLQYRMGTSPLERLRKSVQDGRAQVWLYDRFRDHGMPGRSIALTLRGWAEVAVLPVRRLTGRSGGSGVLRALGFAVGRVLGSIERRVLYL